MSATQRDVTVDAVRGLAVFGMVAPNMIAALMPPAPYWLRVYGSFAAPFFIALAGMMVSLTTRQKHYPYAHYLKRAGLLLLTAGLVDTIVNRYIPYCAMDVLYLAAVSLPIAGALRYSRRGTALAMIAVLALAPLLRMWLGYADYPHEFYLTGERTFVPHRPTHIWQHWLVDGWFPVFPWLAVALFGMLLGQWRAQRRDDLFAQGRFGLAGALLLAAGIAASLAFPPPALVRGDYAEIFYPPELPHLTMAMGALMTTLFVVRRSPELVGWRLLRPLGEASLFFYILHLLAIGLVVRPLFKQLALLPFLAVSLGLASFLIAAAFGLRAFKRGRRLSYGWHFLLGG